jgi:SAM-dependent methyltransferase
MPISPERVQSNAILAEWCAGVRGDVLSLGSGGDIDKQGRHYRQYFPLASVYTTSDLEPEMACDLRLDARWMPEIRTSSRDCIFVSGLLEHVDDYGAVVKEIWRVLRPNGQLLLGVPFKQPIHRAPGDYWRFTEHGVRHLLSAFTIDELRPIGERGFPFGYWVKAHKSCR